MTQATHNQRQRILDAAAQVFAQHGFAGARVDEIARRAEINKAMLYYHVGDKTTLYQAVLNRNFGWLRDRIDEAIAHADTPEDQLRAFITGIIDAMEAVPHHPRIMMRELASGGANMTPEIFAKLASIFEKLRIILDCGVDCGRFRPMSPLLTHLCVVSSVIMTATVRPMLERYKDLVSGLNLDEHLWEHGELAQNMTTLLMRGLVRGDVEC